MNASARPTLTIDPTDDAHMARITTRPEWVHVEAYGVELSVWPDKETGAPVVEVSTDGLTETAAGPVMRLSLNDHDYLDNAAGDGESMTPAGVARRKLAAAIETVSAELAEHDDGTFRTLLLDAGVFQNCRRCGWTMGPADEECEGCGVDWGTALTDPDA